MPLSAQQTGDKLGVPDIMVVGGAQMFIIDFEDGPGR
jgi:hypothetical protein